MKKQLLVILFVLAGTLSYAQTNVYVNSAASGANNGTSWANAFTNLESAVNAANTGSANYNIYVAGGTYKPSNQHGGINRDVFFGISRGGIKIYGGYDAGSGNRNITANPTILSGDIGVAADDTDNAYHVLVVAGLQNNADSVVVDGFSIKDSKADGNDLLNFNGADIGQYQGGGFFALNNANAGKIMLRNCTFSQNFGSYGGGALLESTAATFSKCTFSSNNSQSGAGIAALADAAVKVVECQFNDNNASSYAGAIFAEYNASVNIEKSTFDHNHSDFNAGAIVTNGGIFVLKSSTFSNNSAQQMGGAVFTMQLQEGSLISGCKFLNNTAAFGGALSFASTTSAKVTESIFEGNTATTNGGAVISSFDNGLNFANTFFINNSATAGTGGAYSSSSWQGGSFTNCVFAGNAATQGGAVALSNASGGSFNLCTFNNNSASADGQTIYLPNGEGSISNSIVWKDANYTGTDNINMPSSVATLTLKNNLIQQANVGGAALATTNINANPTFVNAASVKGADGIYGTEDDGLYLMAGSPAVNAGDNILIPAGITTDITGGLRTRQNSVDMGAYESNFSAPFITAQPTNISTCENGTATFIITATGAASYQWQVFDGTSYTNLSNGGSYSGATTATLTITSATAALNGMKYLCNVTNGFGTTLSEMGTLTVTSINVNLTTTNVACNGAANGTAVVVASGGTAPYTYSWKFLANNKVIGTTTEVDSLAVGNYQLTVTDSASCSKTVNFTITEPTAISISIAKTDVTTCNTDASGAATATVTGGTAPYTYSWKLPENSLEVSTTATMSNLRAGKYMLTVTDAKGCTKLDSVKIASPAAFVVVAEQTNVTDFNSPDGMAKVTVSGAVAPYTYLWTKGATTVGTTNTISNVTGGKYTCTITDANGCTFVQNFTLITPVVRTVYVNQAAASGGDGISWASAFQTLKDALAFSNQNLTIDEIRIAQGTYYPTGAQTNTGRDQMFLITRGGIKLFGGYNATTGQRDVANNTTILSGNIADINNVSDNSMKVMAVLGIPRGADSIRVDGLTIQDAVGDGNWFDYFNINGVDVYAHEGSALYLRNCYNNVIFSNCVLKNNETDGIGNISIYEAKLKLDNCTIENNKARAVSVFNVNGFKPNLELINCKIRNNSSQNSGISVSGGKITIKSSVFESNSTQGLASTIYISNDFNSEVNLEVEDSKFENNVAVGKGTVFLQGGSASFKKTLFISNSAEEGAAIFCQTSSYSTSVDIDIDQCVFSNNISRLGTKVINAKASGVVLKMNNSLFIGNRSNATGPVVTVRNSNIKNVTFYDNGKVGDQFTIEGYIGTNNLSNTIFWNNKASSDVNSSFFSISYSVVRGQNAASGNISTDPLFVDASNPIGADGIWGTADDGLRLQNCSPAVNKGWNDGIANDAKDLLGNARIQDGRADMGAYERVAAAQAQLITSGSTKASNLQPSSGTATYVDECGNLLAKATSIAPLPTRIVYQQNIPTFGVYDFDMVSRVTQANPVPSNIILGSRNVEAAPAINSTSNTATYLITLYYTQTDFNDYNTRYPSAVPLPQNSGEVPALANLVIYNYEGESSDGSLMPNTYPSATPNKLAVNSCTYNATLGVWEVTFSTSTLGGFFFGTEATTLPLSLLSFTGKATTNGNQLVWKTAKESNLTHYVLERSSNGKEFNEISTVKPKNGEEQQYSYLDKTAFNGTFYYRLEITENDGKVSYSDVVALKGFAEVATLLTPNPADQYIDLKISDLTLLNTYAIFISSNGQVVKKQLVTSNAQRVVLTDIPAGFYLIKLNNGETLKMVKR